jgi:sulfatase maturation enzyme AslB (radical SAM superfamily)
MAIPLPIADHDAPMVPLRHLDQLWFQVAGLLCNLSCHHCFVSSNPHNRQFDFLTLEQVRDRLVESVGVGVKEYYFTGGEPFLNPEMVDILELALQYGPSTVLTNGTVLKRSWLDRLRRADDASRFSLEFRVSIDGDGPETNDPIRGQGTFARAIEGVRQLVELGFLPIVTVADMSDGEGTPHLFERMVTALKRVGYERPRIKILPSIRLGAEMSRSRGYRNDERVSKELLSGFDLGQLLCHSARLVSARGVHVCPILVEAPDARLGQSLAESRQAFPLKYQACHTCFVYGSICSNLSGSGHDG